MNRFLSWSLVVLMFGFVGCGSAKEPVEPAPKPTETTEINGKQPVDGTATDQPGDGTTKVPVETGPPTVPEVYLSGQHAESSLLKVGDTVPELSFKTMDGNDATLGELTGGDANRLTILAFWQSGTPESEIQLKDIEDSILVSLKDKPVALVSVSVGGSADAAKAEMESAGATYPVVLDPEGESFLKLANNFIPRVYLLDADNKIIWFDIGHTRETRRNLETAIAAKLAE